ncbi:MAG: HlyD family secretion protein [Jhaorihella sp.]
MLEVLVCAMVTVLPDYLIRRHVQGKRIGREITLFTVWYELRYGLTACAILALSLITVIFYYHPSTGNVSSFFRTVTILPERSGRVKEVLVARDQLVTAGTPIFSMEDDTQRAAVETARARMAEIEAQFAMTEAELDAAQGVVDQAASTLKQARDELAVQQELMDRGSSAANRREIERLENIVTTRDGALASAEANFRAVETKKTVLLPAQHDTARAVLAEAETALANSIVYASVSGFLQQFALQPGDIVNPLRPAGILVPPEVGQDTFTAGFDQVSAQVLKVGMYGEVTCISLPYKIIPVQVTAVQEFLPSGQFRPTDRLLDVQDYNRPGTVIVSLKPVFEHSADRVPRGSRCIANVYTNSHERLSGDDVSFGEYLFFHAVDTVGVVHALLLRIQALLLPVQLLVLSGH